MRGGCLRVRNCVNLLEPCPLFKSLVNSWRTFPNFLETSEANMHACTILVVPARKCEEWLEWKAWWNLGNSQINSEDAFQVRTQNMRSMIVWPEPCQKEGWVSVSLAPWIPHRSPIFISGTSKARLIDKTAFGAFSIWKGSRETQEIRRGANPLKFRFARSIH